MAEISKYKAHAVGRLFLHNLRKEDDGVTHSNEYIDPERTHLISTEIIRGLPYG